MATNKPKLVPFRRKREQRTNYKKRRALLESQKPRLVIRKTVGNTIAQVINYHPVGDAVVTTFKSDLLRKYGWKGNTANLPAAYLTGYAVAKRAQAKGVVEAVLDLGLQSKTSSRLFACLKGAIDAGLKIPHDASVFPDESRLFGEHIASEVKGEMESIISQLK